MEFIYLYVEAKVGGMFSKSNHRTLIDQYAKDGWRFVDAIATSFHGNNGQVKTYDLVFEKKVEPTSDIT